MDEIFARIQGVLHYLQRVANQNGVVLDILVQARRDTNAAKRFFRRLLRARFGNATVVVVQRVFLRFRCSRPRFVWRSISWLPQGLWRIALLFRQKLY
jgi:transposase-like protein